MHPRRRAVRVMMMAVVAMIQHDNIRRLWYAGLPVNGHGPHASTIFSIVTIQILHGTWLTSS
jgi:hypothetical protein